MAADVESKPEELDHQSVVEHDESTGQPTQSASPKTSKAKVHTLNQISPGSAKRRCVSTACIACRKRKSKCDGNTPSCAACSSVYNTECVYDPNSDHRRKGVYKKDIDNLKTRNSTLQTLIQAILNYPEPEVQGLVKQIRTCESLDDVAESIISRNQALEEEDEADQEMLQDFSSPSTVPTFEKELSGKLGKLRLENGSVSIIGGTSNLIYVGPGQDVSTEAYSSDELEDFTITRDPLASWTKVTSDPQLVLHLMTMYFTWHYTFFTTLSRTLFWRDFKQGNPSRDTKYKTEFCTPLLVNTMLALGCHFTSWPAARAHPEDSGTAGDHFFKEAKRLILENDEHEKPRLATVQALALMSVREAGCGREARGWVYSGMSFRMAYDLGLNIGSGAEDMEDSEVDARRITMWGCFLFDKCWSNYLGRQPQLPLSGISVPKIDVFPMEDADVWRPHMDSGTGQAHAQPCRTRAVALQISQLCEISSDLLLYFYHPHQLEKPLGKQAELKKLSELHTRLESWRKDLPKEFDAREGQLPNVLVMHMFFHLLYIHLFRPFLKYKPASSPLPAQVSPRKFLIQAATAISKLLRLYRRTYGLRQICNIVVYIAHSACTIHLLNLPDKFASRDIVHGLHHLEEISESWLCARRALTILSQVSKRWNIELPDAALDTLERAETKFGMMRGNPQSMTPKSNNSVPSRSPKPNQPIPPLQAEASSSRPLPASTVADSNVLNYASLDAGSTSSTQLPRSEAIIDPSPQKTAALDGYYGQQYSGIPQSQLQHQVPYQVWNGDQTTQATAPHPPMDSPTMLLSGGTEGLIKDQEWWLQDSNQIFANWNGYEPHEHGAMVRDGFTGDATARMGGGVGNGVTDDMATTRGDVMNSRSVNGGIYGYNIEAGHMDGNMDGLTYRRD